MAEIAKIHQAQQGWLRLMGQIHAEMASRQVHAARTVILLPYAQLMQQARQAWLVLANAGAGSSMPGAQFLPRFETSMNWTRSLGGFSPAPDDLRMDAACDLLTAGSLLQRAGLAEHKQELGTRLMEAAWSLADVAAAVPPAQRVQWGQRLSAVLSATMDTPALAMEAATASLALAWAANSAYPTDAIFSAAPDFVVLLEGFQTEPMAQALQQAMGERLLRLSLLQSLDAVQPLPLSSMLLLHAAHDAEDEAQRAAACVLTHLAAGHSPVALVAQDRLLTRRVRAMLGQRGVAVRDETGWKLSTTRAAASLMSLLHAQQWDASTDALLEWLKNAPAFDAAALMQAEIKWRRMGWRDWRSLPQDDALVLQVQALRDTLQAARPLTRWLHDLRLALLAAGQWDGLAQDRAGQAVLQALRLHPGAEQEFAGITARISQSEFIHWLSQTLEAASFLPEHPSADTPDQVVILPLSQLLGRPLAAVVLPGCDEVRLPMSPEPPGPWTPAQRVLLGLPSREALAQAGLASWNYALRFECLDILWRQSEGGEQLMASGYVQLLQLQQRLPMAADPRVLRALSEQVSTMPGPTGAALPVQRLSSTAYEDLRRCPYRFFALRQLKLQEADELDSEVDKRDFGNWLHCVLRHFHEALQSSPGVDDSARLALINAASEQATQELGLSSSEFLPFSAAWPRVREGYLQWLHEHESSGAHFVSAETWHQTPLGPLTLVGKIDRIDRLADGSALVMDYKTEAAANTALRIKAPLEDTQLAFYAALLSDDTLAGSYVNVGERDGSKTYEQSDIVMLRDLLLENIVSDMRRVAEGAPMLALGAGKACEFCAARGLCRKDFWGAS